VLLQLNTHWKNIPETQQLLHTTLHYLDGHINIELVLPLNIIQSGKNANELSQQIETASKQLSCIGSVVILYK